MVLERGSSEKLRVYIFFADRWYGFDDGLYAAARLLEILAADVNDADTVFKTFPDSVNTPELKVPIAEGEKFAYIKQLIDCGADENLKNNNGNTPHDILEKWKNEAN